MNARQKIILIILMVLSLVTSIGFSKEKKVKSMQMINNFGFDTWNFNAPSCKKISKLMVKTFSQCVDQGTSKTKGRFTQYKCKLKNKSEILIYAKKSICKKQYQSMYIEAY